MGQTPENDAPAYCPKCLGLGGWPCNTGMPHYVIPPVVCACGHPPEDHDGDGACMHLCDCAWP